MPPPREFRRSVRHAAPRPPGACYLEALSNSSQLIWKAQSCLFMFASRPEPGPFLLARRVLQQFLVALIQGLVAHVENKDIEERIKNSALIMG